MAMEEWENYYAEATDYCNVARNAARKGKLGNMVIYNIVCMSVENFMTSILVSEGIYPEHSSITVMMREIKKLREIPDKFSSEVRFLNSFMNFCSLEVTPEKIPTDEEVARMAAFVGDFKEWTQAYLVKSEVKK